MSSQFSIYAKYFWDLNEKALRETGQIFKKPNHPKFASRVVTFLSRCQEPKELFSLISKESFVKVWPKVRLYWRKISPASDFRDWWQTIYEGLLEEQRFKYRKPKGKPSSLFLKVGKIVKEARIKKGLSQKELALTAEMSQPDISMIEEGRKNITLQTLFRLCKILEIKKIEF